MSKEKSFQVLRNKFLGIEDDSYWKFFLLVLVHEEDGGDDVLLPVFTELGMGEEIKFIFETCLQFPAKDNGYYFVFPHLPISKHSIIIIIIKYYIR